MNDPALVLCHIGTPLPEHVADCIQQIRMFSDIRIHIVTDDFPQECQTNKITVVPTSALNGHCLVKRALASDFKRDESNPLWRTAALRFAYMGALADEHDLEEIIHFDNDILIYQDPIALLEKLGMGNDISITECNDELLICGFVYMRDGSTAIQLAKAMFDKMEEVDDNEMRLLRLVADDHPEWFSFLPLLPDMDRAYDYGCVFDCASWGQYVGGTHYGHRSGWTGDHHIVGRAIRSGKVDLAWVSDSEGRRIPVCFETRGERRSYPIANLHIHSKKLYKYVS